MQWMITLNYSLWTARKFYNSLSHFYKKTDSGFKSSTASLWCWFDSEIKTTFEHNVTLKALRILIKPNPVHLLAVAALRSDAALVARHAVVVVVVRDEGLAADRLLAAVTHEAVLVPGRVAVLQHPGPWWTQRGGDREFISDVQHHRSFQLSVIIQAANADTDVIQLRYQHENDTNLVSLWYWYHSDTILLWYQ